MRRLALGWLAVTLPVFVACLALSGCKRVDEDIIDIQSASGGAKGAGTEMTPIKMGKGDKGIIKGRVVWKGNKPDMAQLNAALLEKMKAQKDDLNVCLCQGCPKGQITDQTYRIGNNNGVGNVVVWVTPPDRNSYFEFTPDDLKTLKLDPVMISQPHCAFVPHVAWAFTDYLTPEPKKPRKTKPTGQVVKVENNARISHNTTWEDVGRSIRGANKMLPPGGDPITLPLAPETEPVTIQCTIHRWMTGYIWDFNHPYVDITKYDDDNPDSDKYGTYEIHNVPTGVKLRIVAWHEAKKFLTPDQKYTGGEEIVVKEGEPFVKDFEISN